MTSSNLRFHPQVVQDLQQAFNWYEEQADGLGGLFYTEVDARFDDIIRQPDIFGRAFDGLDYRFARLRKFPYLTIFRLSGSTVEVLGIFHTASNPDKWRR